MINSIFQPSASSLSPPSDLSTWCVWWGLPRQGRQRGKINSQQRRWCLPRPWKKKRNIKETCVPEVRSPFIETWISRTAKGTSISLKKEKTLKRKIFWHSYLSNHWVSVATQRNQSRWPRPVPLLLSPISPPGQEELVHNISHLDQQRHKLKDSPFLWRSCAGGWLGVDGNVETNHNFDQSWNWTRSTTLCTVAAPTAVPWRDGGDWEPVS